MLSLVVSFKLKTGTVVVERCVTEMFEVTEKSSSATGYVCAYSVFDIISLTVVVLFE